jgi:hypothetical protein
MSMMRVDLNRRPYHAQLRMLGDGRDGRQWALITWQQRVSIDGDGRTMPYAAWVPAGQLSQPAWMEREAVRVAKLPSDPAQWPCLARWDGIYAGPWADGDLPAPDGVEILTNG